MFVNTYAFAGEKLSSDLLKKYPDQSVLSRLESVIRGQLGRKLFVSKFLNFIVTQPQSFASLLFIGVKVSLTQMHVTIPFERKNMRGDTVEKPPIVLNHNDTAGIIQNGLLQCPQGIDV